MQLQKLAVKTLLFVILLSPFVNLYFNQVYMTNLPAEQCKSTTLEDNKITSSSFDPKTGYAIVIGIADYPGSDYDLSYSDDDAQEVYAMLINEYNFEPSNIIYIQDSAATNTAISSVLNTIAAEADSNDVFFFYYSGHGGANMDTTQFAASVSSPHNYPNYCDRYWSIYGGSGAVNMRVHFSRLETESGYDYVFVGDSDLPAGYYYYYYTGTYSSGLWSGWVPVLSDKRIWINLWSDNIYTDWGFNINYYEVETPNGIHYICPYDSITYPSQYYFDYLLDSKLDSINCTEKYVVCDSCFSGGLAPETQSSGRYLLMACLGDESSLEDSDIQNGVFTYYFLRAQDYATDSNGDGVISMEESYDYIYTNTVSRSSTLGYTHHPLESDGISGESVLQPALGAVSFQKAGNCLNYSFNLCGNGAIQNGSLIIASVNTTAVVWEILDLSSIAPTSTGFGHYLGSISLNGAKNINNYGIIVQVQGNQLITLANTNSTDIDLDLIDDVTELLEGMDPRTSDTDSDGLSDYVEFHGNTDPANNDTDGDLLSDGYEYFNGLNNINPDTDGDGLEDGFEILVLHISATDPDMDDDLILDGYEYSNNLNLNGNDAGNDYDSDGLTNLQEFQLNSAANNTDSDGDNITDGEEVYTYYTNPANSDTDNDGLMDKLEIFIYCTNPNNGDTDGDSVLDGLEALILHSNVTNPDSDYDLMPDGYEYANNLNLTLDDTGTDLDGDGLPNLLECQLGSSASTTDSDGDGMPDLFELQNGLNLILNDARADPDGDGLFNLLEYQVGASVNVSDSDDDGVNDGAEYYIYSTNSIVSDTDQDGLTDYAELFSYHTEPLVYDTDGDGCSDGMEIALGLNPLNPQSALYSLILNIVGIVLIIAIAILSTYGIVKARNRAKAPNLEGIFTIKVVPGSYDGIRVVVRTKPRPPPSYSDSYSNPDRPTTSTVYYQRESTQSSSPSPTSLDDIQKFIRFMASQRTDAPRKACPWCGYENKSSNFFCARCNRPLEGPGTRVSGRMCPWCGYTNDSSNLYCARCRRLTI